MRPNIVLIVADDLGYGDLGCWNGGLSQTPALDALASEGVSLAQHYSASPVCAPARASLLTGRYPHRTGAIDTLEMRGLDRLALQETTIADLLRDAGYATGMVGKWHNGALDPRYHPNRRGFEQFAGFSGGWHPYFDWRLDRNGVESKSDGRYLTDVFTDEAIGFIERHAQAPFFLYLAYSAPHFPFEAPAEDVAPFAATGRFTRAVATLYGMVKGMDRGVARVREALARDGLEENTLVLFTSDNGPQFGGKGDDCTDRFNCGYRGAKGLVYEGGIRLPMLLRWPAGFDGRRELGALVHLSDWLPTLLRVAGAEPPAGLALDGVDVLPLLRGERGAVPTTRFWQWNRYSPAAECNAAMRDADWKLVRPAIRECMQLAPADLAMDVDAKYRPERHLDIVRAPEPARAAFRVPPAQLFDLARDPFEAHDLAGEQPDRVLRMERALGAWFEDVERERRRIA